MQKISFFTCSSCVCLQKLLFMTMGLAVEVMREIGSNLHDYQQVEERWNCVESVFMERWVMPHPTVCYMTLLVLFFCFTNTTQQTHAFATMCCKKGN